MLGGATGGGVGGREIRRERVPGADVANPGAVAVLPNEQVREPAPQEVALVGGEDHERERIRAWRQDRARVRGGRRVAILEVSDELGELAAALARANPERRAGDVAAGEDRRARRGSATTSISKVVRAGRG